MIMDDMAARKDRYFILFIFLAAFLVRMIYIVQVLQFPLTEYLAGSSTFDQYGFDKAASFIVSGNWLGGEGVFGKEPLYAYFLALIYKVFGYSPFAVYIAQSFLTSLGVVLLYKITAQIFNRVTGYIASFVLAFYSMSIFYDAVLLRASLITFLTILALYLLLEARSKKGYLMWLFSGIALGLSVLTRHNILLPFIVFFILVTVRPFKSATKYVSVFIAGMFIVLLPVLARNYILSGMGKIGISSEINAFWVGNTYNSSGVDFEPSDPEYRDLEFRSRGSAGKTASLFFSEINKRPAWYLRLYARKAWMFFNGYEAPSNTNYYLYREEFPTVLRWPLFSFRLVCSLAILGILLSVLRQKRPYLALIFLGVLSGSVILFHVQSRFRLPAAPLFIIFCSYAVYFIFDKMKEGRLIRSLAIIALAIFFYALLRSDLTYAGFRHGGDRIRPLDRTNLALAYIENKDLKPALRQCNLAIERERHSYIPYAIKAHIYFLEYRYDDAIGGYKKALVYESRNPFLYNEIAGVYYSQKVYDKAWLYAKRALRLFPENKVFEKNLSMISLSQR